MVHFFLSRTVTRKLPYKEVPIRVVTLIQSILKLFGQVKYDYKLSNIFFFRRINHTGPIWIIRRYEWKCAFVAVSFSMNTKCKKYVQFAFVCFGGLATGNVAGIREWSFHIMLDITVGTRLQLSLSRSLSLSFINFGANGLEKKWN